RSGTGLCHADADRVVQAIGNLVANAASHGARGEPVTVRTESDDGGFHVSVHNTGPAIPPEVLPRLFDPMVRGQDAGSKGVGLGLSVVGEIVRAHGGRVEAESTAEAGTRFTIHLPRK